MICVNRNFMTERWKTGIDSNGSVVDYINNFGNLLIICYLGGHSANHHIYKSPCLEAEITSDLGKLHKKYITIA